MRTPDAVFLGTVTVVGSATALRPVRRSSGSPSFRNEDCALAVSGRRAIVTTKRQRKTERRLAGGKKTPCFWNGSWTSFGRLTAAFQNRKNFLMEGSHWRPRPFRANFRRACAVHPLLPLTADGTIRMLTGRSNARARSSVVEQLAFNQLVVGSI